MKILELGLECLAADGVDADLNASGKLRGDHAGSRPRFAVVAEPRDENLLAPDDP